MMRIVFKLLLLPLLAGLTACMPPAKPGGEAQAARSSPVNLAALQLRNLLSYDVYIDGSIVHALFAAETNVRKKPFVGYLRSEDGGKHWSQPNEIGHFVAETMESAAGNEIQIAAAGDTLLAIWQVSGEIPGMGPLKTLYSPDGGQTWQAGSNPTNSTYDQSHPELAADTQGLFHLVWLDDRDENGYQGIRYARSSDAGRHWDLAQTLDESSCSCCWNRLLMGTDGQNYALYRDMEPRDMALAQTLDGGISWRKISTVGDFNWIFDGCPHNGGALARAGDTLHSLVWTGAENKAGLYHLRSPDNGKSWSPPQTLGMETMAFHSDLVVMSENQLLAVWDTRGANGSVVMISRSSDNGEHWSTAEQISTPGSAASFPRLVSTQAGVLALWFEQSPGESKRWVSALFEKF